MMRLMIIGLLTISLALTANLTHADDAETPRSETATADASAVLDCAVDGAVEGVSDEQTSDLATTSEPATRALSAECRACIGDCREDINLCQWANCPYPTYACNACQSTFNGCIANCHANVC